MRTWQAVNGGRDSLWFANAVWFIRLRWMAIAAMLATSVLGWRGNVLLTRYRLSIPVVPFLVFAFVLAVCNLIYSYDIRHVVGAGRDPERALRNKLLVQVFVDLSVLTLVVYHTGVLETYMPFAYLFHAVLSCIFLSRALSLVVILLSTAGFVGCALFEYFGILSPQSLIIGPFLRERLFEEPALLAVQILSGVFIFLTLWYLVSHLASLAREHETGLEKANAELRQTDQDRAWYALHVAHEMKSPFAAIQSCVQALQKGYCGALNDEVRSMLDIVDVRCRKLSEQIKEIIQLANLRSPSAQRRPQAVLDVSLVVSRAADLLRPSASGRQISIELSLEPVNVLGDAEQLTMLFVNVIGNAVLYSHTGGKVLVRTGLRADGRPFAVVLDHGIGIPERCLPHIFEEYYRSSEAGRHNPLSTGLGLAIVKRVAEMHGIELDVQSDLGKGTEFTVLFPVSPVKTRRTVNEGRRQESEAVAPS